MKAVTPEGYLIPTLDRNGSMAIAMDNFTFVDMAKYKEGVVLKMLGLRPAFKKRRGMIIVRL